MKTNHFCGHALGRSLNKIRTSHFCMYCDLSRSLHNKDLETIHFLYNCDLGRSPNNKDRSNHFCGNCDPSCSPHNKD